MPKFGYRSMKNLSTCDPRLQELFHKVIEKYDCSVICGHRNAHQQKKAFHEGKSKLNWPDSKHNKNPSLAVDVIPWPVDWLDMKRFYHFVGYVTAVAEMLNIPIRSGADWDGDFNLKDQNFMDLPHFEIIGE